MYHNYFIFYKLAQCMSKNNITHSVSQNKINTLTQCITKKKIINSVLPKKKKIKCITKKKKNK